MRTFAKYAFLSVLGTLGISCYILADTFFISKGVGANGLAALNLAIPIYDFIHGCGLMLGMGGGTRFSICKGEKRERDFIYSNTVILGILIGIAFSLLGFLFSRPLALALGANQEILEMTVTYLKWMLLFSPAFVLNEILLCFVRNDNGPTLATCAMIIGSLSNILLDYIFIFPMNLGIFGAVIATGASPIVSMMVMSLHWLKKKNTFHFRWTRLYGRIVRQDISLGLPSFIGQMAAGISMIIFNILILKLEGNIGIAAYGVIANISLVTTGIYTGISQGVQPLVSESYGKGDRRKTELGYQYSVRVTLILSAVLYLALYFGASPVTHAFNSENNRRLQEIAEKGLKLYYLSLAFVGYNTVLAVILTSIEKALPAQILSLLRGFFLLIPMAFLLSATGGMEGIWLTCPVTEAIVAILGWRQYQRLRRDDGRKYIQRAK
ncbi:MAG: MATE family efflux transporter [Eubacteriales bacterium]|nr:MATE family efflux transporter [Eubacteriales bacterium]